MKKIINGSKYDTATAKLLGNWDNGCDYSDFNYCEESLYRTKSGKYFLHGEGGARTQYARSCGNNSWTGGQEIQPMTRQAAMDWAEEHLNGDEYEEIFGEVPEGDEQESLNLLIAASLKDRLRVAAEEKGVTLTDLVEGILEKALK